MRAKPHFGRIYISIRQNFLAVTLFRSFLDYERKYCHGRFSRWLGTLVECDTTIRNTEFLAIRTGSDQSGGPHHWSTLHLHLLYLMVPLVGLS